MILPCFKYWNLFYIHYYSFIWILHLCIIFVQWYCWVLWALNCDIVCSETKLISLLEADISSSRSPVSATLLVRDGCCKSRESYEYCEKWVVGRSVTAEDLRRFGSDPIARKQRYVWLWLPSVHQFQLAMTPLSVSLRVGENFEQLKILNLSSAHTRHSLGSRRKRKICIWLSDLRIESTSARQKKHPKIAETGGCFLRALYMG